MLHTTLTMASAERKAAQANHAVDRPVGARQHPVPGDVRTTEDALQRTSSRRTWR